MICTQLLTSINWPKSQWTIFHIMTGRQCAVNFSWCGTLSLLKLYRVNDNRPTIVIFNHSFWRWFVSESFEPAMAWHGLLWPVALAWSFKGQSHQKPGQHITNLVLLLVLPSSRLWLSSHSARNSLELRKIQTLVYPFKTNLHMPELGFERVRVELDPWALNSRNVAAPEVTASLTTACRFDQWL